MSKKLLSRQEVADFTNFWEGGEIPENVTLGSRPILYSIRFLGNLNKTKRWGGELYSSRGALFILGCFLYEHHRRVVSNHRLEFPQRLLQKERC